MWLWEKHKSPSVIFHTEKDSTKTVQTFVAAKFNFMIEKSKNHIVDKKSYFSLIRIYIILETHRYT